MWSVSCLLDVVFVCVEDDVCENVFLQCECLMEVECPRKQPRCL